MTNSNLVPEIQISEEQALNFDSNQFTNKKNFFVQHKIMWCLGVIVGLIVILLFYFLMILKYDWPAPAFLKPSLVEFGVVKKFTSEDEFKNYLSQASELSQSKYSRTWVAANEASFFDSTFGDNIDLSAGDLSGDGQSVRYSQTNVQVAGVDEPDIVKNSGKKIYFSSSEYYRLNPIPGWSGGGVAPFSKKYIDIISAFPAETASVAGAIETSQEREVELLLYNDVLLVFTENKITAYNISNSEQPVQVWNMQFKDNTRLVTARLNGDKVVLIIKTNIDLIRPLCSLDVVTINEQNVNLNCLNIYHPQQIMPVDSTYTLFKMDVNNGQVEKETSFVGSAENSIIYVSPQQIYVAYGYTGDMIAYFIDFFKQNSDIVPAWATERLQKIQTYDISFNAKMIELEAVWQELANQTIFKRYETYSALEKISVELENRLQEYHKVHQRDLQKTAIVRFNNNTMEMTATTEVPGRVLNQFALDEYNGYLRIATTADGNAIPFIFSERDQSTNDIYVLDDNLKRVGSILDLGLKEKIYAVRFVNDWGYMVTFRQTDPFYIIDLINPASPKLAGELKIPGYSSYLHPIDKTHVLGFGREENKVKISLFNVENPAQPIEQVKYQFDEVWSDILNNHHAFLLDDKHKIFFLPGSKGGYVFSYKNNELVQLKFIEGQAVQRAVYIDDYLYIISNDTIKIIDENNWEQINELDLKISLNASGKISTSQDRDKERLETIKSIQTQLEIYYKDFGSYPIAVSNMILGFSEGEKPLHYGSLIHCGLNTGFVPWNPEINKEIGCSEVGDKIYLSNILKNPEPGGSSYTYYSVDGKTYVLNFTLEKGLEGLSAGPHIVSPAGIK